MCKLPVPAVFTHPICLKDLKPSRSVCITLLLTGREVNCSPIIKKTYLNTIFYKLPITMRIDFFSVANVECGYTLNEETICECPEKRCYQEGTHGDV